MIVVWGSLYSLFREGNNLPLRYAIENPLRPYDVADILVNYKLQVVRYGGNAMSTIDRAHRVMKRTYA